MGVDYHAVMELLRTIEVPERDLLCAGSRAAALPAAQRRDEALERCRPDEGACGPCLLAKRLRLWRVSRRVGRVLYCLCHGHATAEDSPPGVYLEKIKGRDQANAYLKKWQARLENSGVALNLLANLREDDFAGAVVTDDEAYVDEFIKDTYELLVSMGKVELKDSLVRIPALGLIAATKDKGVGFKFGNDLPANCLVVLNELSAFKEYAETVREHFSSDKLRAEFVLDRLGSIVDNRYVLIVGTEEEISGFCGLSNHFQHTFDQHRIYLPNMPLSEFYGLYLENLDMNVKNQIVDMEAFEDAFNRYVNFNRDSMPFHGRELADYLAKYSNASGQSMLPLDRYRDSSLDEMLDRVVGLQQVKDTVRNLEDYVRLRKLAEGDGRHLPSAHLHMLFTGNPGTGKTTMAHLIKDMLYKIGVNTLCAEGTISGERMTKIWHELLKGEDCGAGGIQQGLIRAHSRG